jgi:hypothetical protein
MWDLVLSLVLVLFERCNAIRSKEVPVPGGGEACVANSSCISTK